MRYYTVTPPLDDDHDEMDGDSWSRMNPRDDRVPLGCHLNLDDEDDDDDSDNDPDQLRRGPYGLRPGNPLEDDSDADEDTDDDHTAVAGATFRDHESSRPSQSASLRARTLLPPAKQPATTTALLRGATSKGVLARPILITSGLKRSLSEDQLLAGRRAAEHRDYVMFQRLVRGISRRQTEAAWENPRMVNDECLAQHIIRAHHLADDDDDDGDDLMWDAMEESAIATPHRVPHRFVLPPALALPPPVVVPVPMVVRPPVPVGARRAHVDQSLAAGIMGSAHPGPKVLPTLIRPLTLVSVAAASTSAIGPKPAATKAKAPSPSAAASTTMEDAIFDLDL